MSFYFTVGGKFNLMLLGLMRSIKYIYKIYFDKHVYPNFKFSASVNSSLGKQQCKMVKTSCLRVAIGVFQSILSVFVFRDQTFVAN